MPSPADDREVCSLVSELAWRIDGHVRDSVVGVDLTPSQAVALRELLEPLPMKELARRMCCEASNVTYVVERLVQRGLVQRVEHPADRRAKLVQLTPAGRRERTRVLRKLGRTSPLAGLEPQELEALRVLLMRAVEDADPVA